MKVLTVSKTAMVIAIMLFLITLISATVFFAEINKDEQSVPPQIEIVLPEEGENN